MHAHPQPLDPYNPLPPSATHTAEEEHVRHPSPFIPIRIPVFAVVIWLNDSIVRILSVGGGTTQHISSNDRGKQRRRTLSDASESLEQGESYELAESKGAGSSGPYQSTTTPGPRPGTTRVTRERVTLSRRKLD